MSSMDRFKKMREELQMEAMNRTKDKEKKPNPKPVKKKGGKK